MTSSDGSWKKPESFGMTEDSKSFIIPWNCLKDYEVSLEKNVYAEPGQRKTFA